VLPTGPNLGFDVSVIVPVYRGRETVGRAILSVAAQTVHPREIIVIDNEPDPELDHFIPTTSIRVRLIQESRRGAGAARNAGLRVAEGAWCAFLDCDDEWEETYLAEMRAAIQARPAVLYAGGAVLVGEDLIRVPAPRFGRSPLNHLLLVNDVSTSSVVVDRRVALAAGGFAQDIASCEDWALWLKMVQYGKPVAVQRARAVRHELGDSPRRLGDESVYKAMNLVVAEILGSAPPRSIAAVAAAGVLRRRATHLLRRGDRAQARRMFISAVALCPRRPSLWYWLCVALLPGSLERALRPAWKRARLMRSLSLRRHQQ
jgi:glycosyltransferase involved in cell wall biosynthesis